MEVNCSFIILIKGNSLEYLPFHTVWTSVAEGVSTPKVGCKPIIWTFFHENCMNLKKNWNGTASLATPLHPPMDISMGLKFDVRMMKTFSSWEITFKRFRESVCQP